MEQSNRVYEKLKKLADDLVEFVSELQEPYKTASVIYITTDLLVRTFSPVEALGIVELIKDEVKHDASVVEVVEVVKRSISKYIS